jgi:sucrose-6-phosphate hydrolase SacC (GH32 family)
MKGFSLVLLSTCVLTGASYAQLSDQSDTLRVRSRLYDERYRPQYHFSPPMHFMNDPNGLIYFNGIYHLYYQYNPTQLVAGNQAWGHAVSSDLIHWVNADPQIAIPEAVSGPLAGQIFTGSTVLDSNNTSGFFNGIPGGGLVAIYTLNQPTREVQNIAYSLDSGYTYTDYSGNPVLSRGNEPNFRDPKVFYYAPTNSWIMAVALPRAHQVLFYRSSDLKSWVYLSAFGPAGLDGLQWECPNLNEVPVQGTNEKKWVLIVGINPGAPQGGSIDEYFVGNFDGTTFTSDDPVARLMDFGKDFYAAQTYNNTPNGDVITVGWLSNWQYTQVVPTYPWRGVFTVARVLSLLPVETAIGTRLVQTPISLDSLRNRLLFNGSFEVTSGGPISLNFGHGGSFEFETTLQATPTPGEQQQRVGIELANYHGEKVVVGYDWSQQYVYIDRGGANGFNNPFFTDKVSVYTANPDNSVKLHVLVDRSVLEVFVDDGKQVGTSEFFMKEGPPTQLRYRAENGTVSVSKLEAYALKSIWR